MSEEEARKMGSRYLKINGIGAHRVVAERALGSELPRGAVVHHVNLDKKDNRTGNLVICEDENYHRLLHKRMAAYESCGHADWVKCNYCKEYDDPANLYIHQKKSSAHHRACAMEYQKEWKNGR